MNVELNMGRKSPNQKTQLDLSGLPSQKKNPTPKTWSSRQQKKWAGIYWLNPANNWGQKKEGGFTLTGAQKLTFWAKGEKGGEQIQEFIVGGIQGDYPDSDKMVIGPVILSSEWRQYIIDLRGKDLSYISGGFAWSTGISVNPESCTFYLDEIKFE